ncbi:WhiB family transcriptional regulator [Streptomyces sp. NPDC000941]
MLELDVLIPPYLLNAEPTPCVGNGDLFIGDRADVAKARVLCADCPMRADCLDYALETREPHGIWGGHTPKERQDILKPKPAQKPLMTAEQALCGTRPAYWQHVAAGERCAECWLMREEWVRQERLERLEREHARPEGGSARGWYVEKQLGLEPCSTCLAARRRAKNAAARSRRTRTRQAATPEPQPASGRVPAASGSLAARAHAPQTAAASRPCPPSPPTWSAGK